MGGELLNIIFWWYNSILTSSSTVYSYKQLLRYFFDGVRQNNLYGSLYDNLGTDWPVYFFGFILTSITAIILIILLFRLFKWIFTLVFKLFRLN